MSYHKGPDTQREAARLYAESLRDVIEILWRNGSTTREIAVILNEEGFTTRLGADWSSMTVWRVLWRLKLEPAKNNT